MFKYLFIGFIVIFFFLSFSFSEKRLDMARAQAEDYEKMCVTQLGRNYSYCGCMRDYMENINAPHAFYHRMSFGYFWRSEQAKEKHAGQRKICQSMR